MSNFSCAPKATLATCSTSDNMSWRYLHFTCGALVLVLASARLAFVKMVQAPRWRIAQNLDEEIIQTLNNISITAQRPHSPTLETLQAGGVVLHTEKSVWSSLRLKMHFKGLFQTRTLALVNHVHSVEPVCYWNGFANIQCLFAILPQITQEQFGSGSNYATWRDYAINHVAGLFGPIIAVI